jgi:hypothetical protein
MHRAARYRELAKGVSPPRGDWLPQLTFGITACSLKSRRLGTRAFGGQSPGVGFRKPQRLSVCSRIEEPSGSHHSHAAYR